MLHLLLFIIFFFILPSVYIIVFIKFVGWILSLENTLLKILIVTGAIILLPVIIYIHLVIIYALGGGH